jgi:hypothetical protein
VLRRQVLTLVAAVAVASATLSADVTVITSMKMEGKAPGMAAQQMPKMVTHIKGMRAATIMDMGGSTMTSIVDLKTRRVVMLNSQMKTAQILDGSTKPGAKVAAPKVDVKVTPTGNTRTLLGVPCTEHTFTMTLAMDEMMGGANVPPEAAAMLNGVSMRMNGSIWSSTAGPAAAEFMAYTKAAVEQRIMEVITGGMGLTGGLDEMMAATTQAPGISYLTEVTMTVEGTGEMVAMMQQMGAMKMVMEVQSVSTDPVPDSIFEIPEGYKTTK